MPWSLSLYWHFPYFTKTFQLEADASDLRVGAVLMQGGHPLVFISKALGSRTKGLPTYEEYLAILIVVDQWRCYFQLAEFVIITNQKSLTHLSYQNSTPSDSIKFSLS
jgi:hypothetical protein